MRNRPSARGVQAAKNVLSNGMWTLRVWPVMAPEHTDWASFSVTSQHVYELRAGYRLAEQVALHLVAAQQAQDLGLIFRFDALGNDRETHRMGQRNHRRNQRRGVGAVVDRGDESAIDLERMHRQLGQVGERRVPGAEIVDGELYTE